MNKLHSYKAVFFSLILVLLFSNALSSSAEEIENHSTRHPSHNNHLALFNGAVTSLTNKITAYAVGLDYEYRLSHLIGAGVLGEYIFTESNEIALGVPLYFHPYYGFLVIAAPAVVFPAGSHDVSHDESIETKFYFRIGTAYDFHINNISLGPAVYFDIGPTRVLTYGLTAGILF